MVEVRGPESLVVLIEISALLFISRVREPKLLLAPDTAFLTAIANPFIAPELYQASQCFSLLGSPQCAVRPA